MDDKRIEELLLGLILLNWKKNPLQSFPSAGLGVQPQSAYALLKLCYHTTAIRDKRITLEPEIAHLAAKGDLRRSMQFATRRLRGSGLSPIVPHFAVSEKRSTRIAAALLFPLSDKDVNRLADAVLAEEKAESLSRVTETQTM